MNYRIRTPVLAVAAVFTLSGCDLLDVNNPNNLTEESVQLESAANGMANGSLRLVSDAVGSVWEGPAVVSDELYWTGSRDAWGQLDQGFISNPENEFTDAAFPNLGQAVWMAQEAVDVIQTHVDNNPGSESFALDLARAQFFNGIILMVTGESQDDMTFSDKMVDGPAVGPANMSSVLDQAITNLDAAITGFGALGEGDLVIAARAVRARAHMSRVIWDQINPTATVGGALSFDAALADAAAVIAAEPGDYAYEFVYSSASAGCSMCGNINNRGENQIDESLADNTGPGATGRTGDVALLDPVDGAPDETVARFLAGFGDDSFLSLPIAGTRLMRLILAEDALQAGDAVTFETHIDALRALDGKADFTSGGAVADLAMLQHERRVNTILKGLRLQDMYRWGISDPLWQGVSDAVQRPGTMLPITIVEIRANCNLNGQGCGG